MLGYDEVDGMVNLETNSDKIQQTNHSQRNCRLQFKCVDGSKTFYETDWLTRKTIKPVDICLTGRNGRFCFR